MKTIAWVILVAAAYGSGCARPDWIERTLVTEDVTGLWYGRYLPSAPFAASAGGSEVWLDLRQEGSKVRGLRRRKNLSSAVGS
jgi:hypothetical protein